MGRKQPIPRFTIGVVCVAVGVAAVVDLLSRGGWEWGDSRPLLISLVMWGIWLDALVSAANYPAGTYRARGLSKTWVVVGVAVVPFGALLYAFVALPRLRSYAAPRPERQRF